MYQTRTILSRAKAQALIGSGSYAATPVYPAVRVVRVPIPVHEANLMIDIANKAVVRFATFIGYTLPNTQTRGEKWIGIPMNHDITQPGIIRIEVRKRFGLDPKRLMLFISGGSQETRAINQAPSVTVPAILNAGTQVLYVLGAKNFTDADAAIELGGGTRRASMAYVDTMIEAYMAADLVIGRAGVGTVMETAVLGLSAIFTLLPWGNSEQARNVTELVANRTDILLPEVEPSVDKLSGLVIPTIVDAEKLARMVGLARPHSPTDTANVLVRAIVDAVQREEAS